MITEKKVNRINELYRKSKTTQGLTPEEMIEQNKLRKEYIAAFRENLKSQLDLIEIVEEEVVEEKQNYN